MLAAKSTFSFALTWFPLLSLGIILLALGIFILVRRLSSAKKRTENLVVKTIGHAQDMLQLSELPVQSSSMGSYTLVEKLYESATSVTYRARNGRGEDFLVKIPTPRLLDDEKFLERFHREAEVIREVNHPNIGRYVEYGVVKERGKKIPYFVLECHEGKKLSEIIKQDAPLPINLVIRILQQVADALAAVHAKNILHRYLKPENVHVGANWKVKLYNFGTEYTGGMLKITQIGSIVHATNYLTPEQINGMPANQQSDLYALGVMGFEMITGHIPFENEDIISLSQRKLEEQPPSVSEYRRDTPAELVTIIDRLISLDLTKRFPSAAVVKEELERVLYS
jgi:serine/threonine-protein kinase